MSNTIIGTRKTIFKLDSVDFTSAVKSVILTSEEGGFGSFTAALAGGPRVYKFKLTLRQDTDATSLWYYIWNELGADNTYEFWPNGGGTTPSATTPKLSGTLVIAEPDGDLLGGEANRSPSMVNEVEVEWECTAKPTMTIA